MNDYTEDFSSMLKRMFTACDEFAIEIATVPGFRNPYEALRGIMVEIDDLVAKKGNRYISYTVAKHLDKYGLSSLAGDIATITCGYAYSINDMELASSLNYNQESLLKFRDEDISSICRNIYDKTFVHKTELVNFGIPLTKFSDLDNKIVEWETTSQMNIVAWEQKRKYTAQILAKVKEGKSLLENILDKVIFSFKAGSPKLYQTYNSYRNNISRLNSKRIEMGTILGYVYIKDEGIPVKAIVGINSSDTDKRMETDMDGEYKFSTPTGVYKVTAHMPGFITKTFENVGIKSDEDLLLNFEMEKIA